MFPRLFSLVGQRWHPLWRLRRSALFRHFQNRFDFTVDVPVPGTGVRVALKLLRDASWITRAASLEPEIRAAFSLALETFRPAVFWDVGANIGFYSWLVRQHAGIERVIMFEPDPTNFSLLERTIRRNRITNCTALNVALADRSGEAGFLIDRASGAAGSLESSRHTGEDWSLQTAYGLGEVIRCRTATLDELIAAGTPAPNLIKIDVEGAENLVLAGAKDCLAKVRPILIVETGDDGFRRALAAEGYVIYRIDSGNLLAAPEELERAPIARQFSRWEEAAGTSV
jgi:FkbM family methyltransferase